MKYRYFAIYKPYGMLSQFTIESEGQSSLKHLGYSFPKDVYPVGRLDADSEGLLILTNDNSLKTRLLNPDDAHERTYWVQLDNDITPEAIAALENGVEIKVNKKPYFTRKVKVQKFLSPPSLPERTPPVRFRKEIPTSWISITLTEGKNRQIRLMTAKVGFPTLRLIRIRMGNITLGEMQPGEVKEIEKKII